MNTIQILFCVSIFITTPLAFIPMAIFGVWAGEKEKKTGNDLWGLAFGIGTYVILCGIGLSPIWIYILIYGK